LVNRRDKISYCHYTVEISKHITEVENFSVVEPEWEKMAPEEGVAQPCCAICQDEKVYQCYGHAYS
jgi:hypothetical protein